MRTSSGRCRKERNLSVTFAAHEVGDSESADDNTNVDTRSKIRISAQASAMKYASRDTDTSPTRLVRPRNVSLPSGDAMHTSSDDDLEGPSWYMGPPSLFSARRLPARSRIVSFGCVDDLFSDDRHSYHPPAPIADVSSDFEKVYGGGVRSTFPAPGSSTSSAVAMKWDDVYMPRTPLHEQYGNALFDPPPSASNYPAMPPRHPRTIRNGRYGGRRIANGYIKFEARKSV